MTALDRKTCPCGTEVVHAVDPARPWWDGFYVPGRAAGFGTRLSVDGEGRTRAYFDIQTGQSPVQGWAAHAGCDADPRPATFTGQQTQTQRVLAGINDLRRAAGKAAWPEFPRRFRAYPRPHPLLSNERCAEAVLQFQQACVAAPGFFEGWVARLVGPEGEPQATYPVSARVPDPSDLRGDAQATLTVDLREVEHIPQGQVVGFFPSAEATRPARVLTLREREHWADLRLLCSHGYDF